MTEFFTTLTTAGEQSVAQWLVTGIQAQFSKMVFGDGNGNYVTPDKSATALVNEVYRVDVSSLTTDPANPNWIVIEAVIPATGGGFYIRELGALNDADELQAVGSFPETYKPVLATENAARDMTIRMVVEVANADAVYMLVDPSIAVATNQSVLNAIGQHRIDPQAHPHYTPLTAFDAHAQDNSRHLTAADITALLPSNSRAYFSNQL